MKKTDQEKLAGASYVYQHYRKLLHKKVQRNNQKSQTRTDKRKLSVQKREY